MPPTQPINVHRFDGHQHHVTTGDPKELSRQDGAMRAYGQLELSRTGKSASFVIYREGNFVMGFSPGIETEELEERGSFTGYEVHRARPGRSENIQYLIAVLRDDEYIHRPVDIADDSIFELLFENVEQGLEPYQKKFRLEDKVKRTVRSLSVLKPDWHFAVTRTRVIGGSVKAFRFWMYLQNDCIIEEVADLEGPDD